MSVLLSSNVGGVTVLTVQRPTGDYYETCLFDDRNGERAGNPSRVVGGAGDRADAIAIHARYVFMSSSELLSEIGFQQWVFVAFVQDSDYDDIAMFGIQEMAEHLAQWDNGHETDMAHMHNGKPWGSFDLEYPVTVDGMDYMLTVNSRMGYASLNRRPMIERY